MCIMKCFIVWSSDYKISFFQEIEGKLKNEAALVMHSHLEEASISLQVCLFVVDEYVIFIWWIVYSIVDVMNLFSS